MLGLNKSTSGKASDRLRLALDQWKIQPAIDAPPAQRNRPQGPETPTPTFTFQWSSRSIRALIAIIAAISLLVGYLWWSGRPQVSASIPIADTGLALSEGAAGDFANTAGVMVHVAGAVKEPGLYELPAGSRVADAVEAAGGVTKKSAADTVNLARELVDGEQITVGTTEQSSAGGISINNATAAELDALPGIGPVLAERIVTYRATNGPFRSIDQLSDVSGIGDSVMEQIRSQVTL